MSRSNDVAPISDWRSCLAEDSCQRRETAGKELPGEFKICLKERLEIRVELNCTKPAKEYRHSEEEPFHIHTNQNICVGIKSSHGTA